MTVISIRIPTLDDQEAFIQAMKFSRALHYPWVEAPCFEVDFTAYIKKYNQPNNISYLILADESIAGVINLNEIVRGCFQNAYLGFYGVVGFENKGIMSQGLKLVLKAAFEKHGLHRLEANIQPDNVNSIRLVSRNGFRKEGFSPRYLKIAGHWRDHERWTITIEDYLAPLYLK